VEAPGKVREVGITVGVGQWWGGRNGPRRRHLSAARWCCGRRWWSLHHIGVEGGGGVKWQPKWKETERWRRSPGRRKAATLSHDSDEMVVPSGRRRLNRRQGEAKGAVKSSV
jgi:hypothetical protein